MLDVVRQVLTTRWGANCDVTEVFVDHHERVVFSTVDRTGCRVVVKADVAGRRLAREAAVLVAAAEMNVAVPAVQEFIDGTPAIPVMPYVDGQPLWDSPDASWYAVGRELRRLHEYARPPYDLPMFGGGPTWWGRCGGPPSLNRARRRPGN